MNTPLIHQLVNTRDNKKFELAGRIAAAIIHITQAQGGCLPQDLNAHDFTPDEIASHWHMARALAVVELKLMSLEHYKKRLFGRSSG
jgi:hypothetical protein